MSDLFSVTDGRRLGDAAKVIAAPSGRAADELVRLNDGDPTRPTQLETVVEALTGNGRTDTFTTTASGTAMDRTLYPTKFYGLQVTGTLTQFGVTTWTVVLEVSLDGVTWMTVLTHTYPAAADGAIIWSADAIPRLAVYVRSRCTALVKGTATNVVAVIVAQ